jgi:hypothetical protein
MNTTHQPAALAAAIDDITAGLERVLAGFANLKAMLVEGAEVPEFDPRDPANKFADGKLTPRGVEICYRLFDAGKTRYSVKEEMNISFSAATHRYEAWKKEGGINRSKQALD